MTFNEGAMIRQMGFSTQEGGFHFRFSRSPDMTAGETSVV